MRTLIALGLIVLGTAGAASALQTGVCVTNGTDQPAFFVAEASGAAQRDATLAPGETLCSAAGNGTGGVVRVFEHTDALEGCARLVDEGQSETLIRYVDFDRCHWSSHDD